MENEIWKVVLSAPYTSDETLAITDSEIRAQSIARSYACTQFSSLEWSNEEKTMIKSYDRMLIIEKVGVNFGNGIDDLDKVSLKFSVRKRFDQLRLFGYEDEILDELINKFIMEDGGYALFSIKKVVERLIEMERTGDIFKICEKINEKIQEQK